MRSTDSVVLTLVGQMMTGLVSRNGLTGLTDQNIDQMIDHATRIETRVRRRSQQ